MQYVTQYTLLKHLRICTLTVSFCTQMATCLQLFPRYFYADFSKFMSFQNMSVKVKGLPVQATKAHRGSRGMAPITLNLGSRLRGRLNVPAVLPPEKKNASTNEQDTWWTHQMVCRVVGDEKNLLPLPGIQPRTVQPVCSHRNV